MTGLIAALVIVVIVALVIVQATLRPAGLTRVLRVVTLLSLTATVLGFGTCGVWGTWAGISIVRQFGWNGGNSFALFCFVASGIGFLIVAASIRNIRQLLRPSAARPSEAVDRGPNP
ncbi:hypothetical protein LRH25_06425 [Ideonella azotifigens]|uniref:MFS transporter n=1 Tax=Ideonella azotifigens TaxID=513160 RepID=A0ABP3V132_9BURK|nr:hypothetical protein [Ideonella azotifigens]MCD2339974.1 hypothetical protein [Ideonella azotifigens]